MAIPSPNVSFGSITGLRLHSDVLMDRDTGRKINDLEHLKKSIADILTTRIGSRVMLRDYGCDAFRLIDRPINRDLITELYAIFHSAIKKWEPRLLVSKVTMNATEWRYGRVILDIEAYYLIENGPIRITDLEINFLNSNRESVIDPERAVFDYGVASFGDIALADPSDPRVFVSTSDNGVVNAAQTAQANFLAGLYPEFYLMPGDLNYDLGGGDTIMANTAVYSVPISNQIVFPAVGNHEENIAAAPGNLTPYLQRYWYLPGNGRYYRLNLFGGLLTVLVINTGYASDGVARLEPDGITVGSRQHQWVLDQLADCQSPYVMVMGHHPFASKVSGGDSMTYPVLAWIKDLPKVQLYLHGHTHTGQHNVYNVDGLPKLHVLEASSGVESSRQMSASGTMYGDASGMQGVWQYAPNGQSGPSVVARFTLTPRQMVVDVLSVSSGSVLHTFNINPWT